MTDLYLIVGLGTPGPKYLATRHNVGWHVLDALADRHRLSFDRTEKKSITGGGNIAGRRVLLVKPQTYMNLSGEAVRALVDFYKIPIDRILIIHDDMDIPLGMLRLRKTGSAGGQRGVRSIIQHLGTQDFSRVRFGIDRPPGRMDPAAYVLQAFQGDAAILAREVTDRAADAVEMWLREGIDRAMTQYNGDISQPAPPPPTDPREELALCLRLHELNPHDPHILERMIGILKRLGQKDEAARRHVQLADIYESMDKLGRAIAHLERAVSLNPAWVAVRRRLANDYLRTGNRKKAVQTWLRIAEDLEGGGQIKEALAALEAGLAINPQHPGALSDIQRLRQSEDEG